MPLISIITVNLNNLLGLKKTMESVIRQSFKDYEYIVIDGASTDGCKDFLFENHKKIDILISEKDKGPYYAMNKGIDFASGKYYLFLNSGDFLYNPSVLQEFYDCDPSEDLIYGNSLLIDNNHETIREMPLVNNLAKSLNNTINHQTIFFSNNLFEDGLKYNCNYNIVADWILINELFRKRNISVRHIDLIISCYDMNGISSDVLKRSEERKHYLNKNFDRDFKNLLNCYRSLQLENKGLRDKKIIRLILGFNQFLKKYIPIYAIFFYYYSYLQ